MTETPYRTALIVGVGGGLSASVARAFSRAGMKIALASRRAADLAGLAKDVGGEAFVCDATKRGDVVHLFGAVEAYAAGITVDVNKLRDSLPEMDMTNPEEALREALSGEGLFRPEDTPQQKVALARLETALQNKPGLRVGDRPDAVGHAGERVLHGQAQQLFIRHAQVRRLLIDDPL